MNLTLRSGRIHVVNLGSLEGMPPMAAVAEKTLLTPDDLLALPDQKRYELVDGELVERHVSVESSWIGCKISRLIGNHVDDHRIGWVFGADNGCQCFKDLPNTVRKPDVTFVSAGRMTWDDFSEGWLQIVPDLAVEVISPNDLADELEVKIQLFHKAGVPLIWVVSPSSRTVRVIRHDGSFAFLGEGDELSGEDIIPGFVCPVSSIFPPIPAEAQPKA
jgi:Uma2 family endonuclease